MVRVGLNGFGRIGRAIARILADRQDACLVAVNEIDEDIHNFAYLLKYDSMYGRCRHRVEADVDAGELRIGDHVVAFSSRADVREVRWQVCGVDGLIEATGVNSNVPAARDLVETHRVRKVVVTNAHHSVDMTIIVGVNDCAYDPARHHVVSSSICDANAIVPALHHLDRRWRVEAAHVTTLHPWLSYQNLLDGPISSIASPGHTWRDYALGRASVANLIPKETTAAQAALVVLPELAGKLEAISFRVPTHLVSASDLCVQLGSATTADDVNAHFIEVARRHPEAIAVETEQLVSSDYIGVSQSCIIAARQTRVVGGHLLKLVTWYDNEWGYSCRVVDVAKLVAATQPV